MVKMLLAFFSLCAIVLTTVAAVSPSDKYCSGNEGSKCEDRMSNQYLSNYQNASTNWTSNVVLDQYSSMFAHRLLLSDYYRVESYHQAIMQSVAEFRGKVVMDVWAGIGIFSIFAAQAGAKRVYAVDPTGIAPHARRLIEANGFSSVITVINKQVEDITEQDIDCEVDTIVTDSFGPIGIGERRLEMFIKARNRFLKKRGVVLPNVLNLYFAPVSDYNMWLAVQQSKERWVSKDYENFHGVNLTSIFALSGADYGRHATLERSSSDTLAAKPFKYSIDMKDVEVEQLEEIEVNLQFPILKNCVIHGILAWFDIGFLDGAFSSPTWLSSSMNHFGTHWNQAKFVFTKGQKIPVNNGELCLVKLVMRVNDKHFGYQVSFDARDCPNNSVQKTEVVVSEHTLQNLGFAMTDLESLAQLDRYLQDNQKFAVFRQAILMNPSDFKDKVVLVVDANACFYPLVIAELGAKHVYAQEITLGHVCEHVVKSSKFGHLITVVRGENLDVVIKEEVDVILSDRYHFLYFNAQLPARFIRANRLLKGPNRAKKGMMFPSEVKLVVAPFSDNMLLHEMESPTSDLYGKRHFHGIDFSSLEEPTYQELIEKPVIDTFAEQALVAPKRSQSFSLLEMTEGDLQHIVVPFDTRASRTAVIDGVATWFELNFNGSTQVITLATGPTDTSTQVWQARLILPKGLFVRKGKRINGTLTLNANNRGSYDILLHIATEESEMKQYYDLFKAHGRNLKNIQQTPRGVGFDTVSPTESFFMKWMPPQAAQPAQQQQMQQLQQQAQIGQLPITQFIKHKFNYMYANTKHRLLGQITGNTFF